MKYTLRFFALALILAASAVGQAEVEIGVYAGGGLTVPTGDLSDLVKTGYNGSLGLGLNMVPTFETVARFSYNSFKLKEDTGTDGDYTVSEYGIDVRANLSAPTQGARPYALIGVGLAKIDFPSQLIEGLPSEIESAYEGLKPDTRFFYCFGGGIKVQAAPRLNLFLEGRYTKISAADVNLDYFPITVGLNISF